MSVEAIPSWDHSQENEMETKVRIAYHEIEMVIHSRKVCAKANEIAYMCRMRGGYLRVNSTGNWQMQEIKTLVEIHCS